MIEDILFDDVYYFVLEKDTVTVGPISAYTLDSGIPLDFDYSTGGEIYF